MTCRLFPSPAHGEIPPVGDPAYDALLARALPAGDAPAGLRLVAEGVRCAPRGASRQRNERRGQRPGGVPRRGRQAS